MANSYDRDDSPGADRDHGSTERADHSGFPQAAGPAVPEKGIGAGRVPGCSCMPGSEKVQPARQSSRTQGGQDTIERHAGLDVVMEKTVQWEQETPTSNGRGMIDDFRLRGSRTWRQRGVLLSNGGVTLKGDMISTTPTPVSQRADPRRCGQRLSRNALQDGERHGFPASVTKQRCEALPRGSLAGRQSNRCGSRGGHIDHRSCAMRTKTPTQAATTRTRCGSKRVPSRWRSSRVDDDPFDPLIQPGDSGFHSMSRTVSAFRHSVISSLRGALPYGCRPGSRSCG